MNDQIIVTIGREHGSGGHYIASILAENLGIALYDKEITEHIVKETGYSNALIDKADEKPVNLFLSRRIGEFSNSIEENVALKIFEFVRSRANEGQSFVIVGRCADMVLRDNMNTIKVFVRGDKEDKIARIMRRENLSEQVAAERIRIMDKNRKTYHNYYCDIKWGDSRGYDICVNSSKAGLEGTAEVLLQYIYAFKRK